MSAARFARFARFARPHAHLLSHLKRTAPSGSNLLPLIDPCAISLSPAGSIASRRPTLFRSMAAEASLEEVGGPKSVKVNEAHELLKAGHRYLDVRTAEEFGTGHAIGAINIPYMFRDGSGHARTVSWVGPCFNLLRFSTYLNEKAAFKDSHGTSKNPSFLQEVSSTFAKNEKIIVGCLSGRRSLMAASELANAGFTGVIDIEGGYSVWSQNGLPTEK